MRCLSHAHGIVFCVEIPWNIHLKELKYWSNYNFMPVKQQRECAREKEKKKGSIIDIYCIVTYCQLSKTLSSKTMPYLCLRRHFLTINATKTEVCLLFVNTQSGFKQNTSKVQIIFLQSTICLFGLITTKYLPFFCLRKLSSMQTETQLFVCLTVHGF